MGSNRRGKLILIFITLLLGAALAGMLVVNRIQEREEEAVLQEYSEQEQTKLRLQIQEVDERFQRVKGKVSAYLPGIVCWGDSLTLGVGGENVSYPMVLQNQISKNITEKLDFSQVSKRVQSHSKKIPTVPVVNMGGWNETTDTILGRNGAVPFVTGSDFLIPEKSEPVKIVLKSQNGSSVAPLRNGNAGMEQVTIAGVEGKISISQDDYNSVEYEYFFTRNAPGEEVSVPMATEIFTSGGEDYRNYIPVIFTGSSDETIDPSGLTGQIRAMLEHQENAPENRYIVIGIPTGTGAERRSLEAKMETAFGEHYINLREYMSGQAMQDADLTPTEEDENRMAQGMVPQSLLGESGGFNRDGYILLGKLVFQRMEQLGYFDEVNYEIENAMRPLGAEELPQTAKPEVEPEQPKPEVEPEQPKPEVEPEQPKPEVEPEQPKPEAEPEQPKPEVEPEQPKPEVEPEQPAEETKPESGKKPVSKKDEDKPEGKKPVSKKDKDKPDEQE